MIDIFTKDKLCWKWLGHPDPGHFRNLEIVGLQSLSGRCFGAGGGGLWGEIKWIGLFMSQFNYCQRDFLSFYDHWFITVTHDRLRPVSGLVLGSWFSCYFVLHEDYINIVGCRRVTQLGGLVPVL